jgi:hypothetical protein
MLSAASAAQDQGDWIGAYFFKRAWPAMLSAAPQPPAVKESLTVAQPEAACTCPSGDGSLRHPCPQHGEPTANSPETPDSSFSEAGAVADDEVLIAIKRGEGYEDVVPQIVAEDALRQWLAGGCKFEWRVVSGNAEDGRTARPNDGEVMQHAPAVDAKVREDAERWRVFMDALCTQVIGGNHPLWTSAMMIKKAPKTKAAVLRRITKAVDAARRLSGKGE